MKQGFFNLGTEGTPEIYQKGSTLKKHGCEACGLLQNCNSPKMLPSGKGQLKILIVGKAPGEGVQFSEKSEEQLLEETLTEIGLIMRQDCSITNAVNCRPEKNKTPSDTQVTQCRPNLLKFINEFKPTVIIPLGSVAVQSVLGHKLSGRFTGISNTAFYGEQIPDRDYNCWVCPSFHPNDLLKTKKDKVLKEKWKKHLKIAVELAKNNTKIPEFNYKDKIRVITKVDNAIKVLQDFNRDVSIVVYDYETTGIKPHREEHRIISVSVCDGKTSYAFPFFNNPLFRNLWKDLMLNPKCQKIAHKADFENIWTAEKMGYFPTPYKWDTCIGAHCLDNKKPTGLKFHAYTKFGILGYDKETEKYITGIKPGEEPKSGNRINRINEADLNKVLYYGGIDSYLTYKLYEYQKERLIGEQLKGFKLFLDGAQTFSKMTQSGIQLDQEQLKEQIYRLGKRMKLCANRIFESPEAKKWQNKKLKLLNFNSNKQLDELLYKILEYEKPREKSVDEEALNKIGTQFTTDIIQHRKYKKIRDTYLSQYKREAVNGIIHPFFNLHLVDTFRSSSDSPNFQNVPKRDKFANQIVRSCIKPSKGNRLISWDYKGIEVSVSVCYHKDPTMFEYVTDDSTDMHRDMAMDLFFRSKEDFTKMERHNAKNGFVFPEFYGSTCRMWRDEDKRIGAGEVTLNIWNMIEDSTKEHLLKNGVEDIKDFQKHVEAIEKKFWEERFEVYNQWKYDIFDDYKKKGYVELYTGFKCFGPMKFTEVTNYPIQGSAFHCTLWTLNQIIDKVSGISERSHIIGQIHDDIVGDIHPDDEEEVDSIIQEYGCGKIRGHWDWIIVPLKIEKEKSEIDGSWDSMKEDKILEVK
jgi:uracil-DNA glycosylase family 4